MRSDSNTSTLMGETMANNSGWREMVELAMGLFMSESDGRGSGVAVSDQLAVVGDKREDESMGHKL